MTKEKRRHDRIKTLNLLNYTCIDERENVTQHGMGRTLNVSESGILMETHVRLDIGSRLMLSIGLEDDLIDIKGKVVFSNPGPEGRYEAGIEFTEKGSAADDIMSDYITAFRKEENIT